MRTGSQSVSPPPYCPASAALGGARENAMDDRLSVRAAPAAPAAPPVPIDEAGIQALVHGFYGRVAEDALLGPIFARQIGEGGWPDHLDKMCAFWSSVLLRTGRYGGRPMPPHLRLAGELSDAHFERWLGLFRETARAELSAEAAAGVIAMAERIANSFRLAVAFHRGDDTTRMRPLPAG